LHQSISHSADARKFWNFQRAFSIEQSITREAVMQQVAGLPPGSLAEVARFIEFLQFKTKPVPRAARRRSGVHPAFGLWANRSDLRDPVEFAQQLRRKIEERRDG
jgi:hypothetical protein